MTASPVVTRVSQATRPMGSCARMASRTESEIWSAILSGCPSVTDSDVKRWRPLRLMRVELLRAARARTGRGQRAAIHGTCSGFPRKQGPATAGRAFQDPPNIAALLGPRQHGGPAGGSGLQVHGRGFGLRLRVLDRPLPF